MKITIGKYLWDDGFQVNLIPCISFMKTYGGYALVFDWLIYYFEIYTGKE